MKFKKYCLGCLSITFGVLSLTFLVVAVVMGSLFDTLSDLVRQQIEEMVTVEPGHATFEQLQDPTLPIHKDFYFFNLTNAEAFAAGEERPNLTQLGPYSYSESRTKQVIEFSNDSTLLTYNQTKLFFWDPDTSGEGLQESDVICTINIPLIGAIMQLEDVAKEHPLIGLAGRVVLRDIFRDTDAKLYACIPAGQLAWNYTDALVMELHTNLALRIAGLAYPRCCVNLQLNDSINDTRPSIIRTGVGNIAQIGEFVQWNSERRLSIWPGPTANEINGTEGFFFRPNLREGQPLMAFVDDVIRSFDLQQESRVRHLDLEAWCYVLNSNTFLAPSNYPPNARWGEWEFDGLIYLGVIQYPTVPIYGSKPHFLDGDPALREKVIGMDPDRRLHDTNIDVEVFTGANIEFRRQLQINVRAERNDEFSQTENLNGTLYYPVGYINEHAELTESFQSYLLDNGLELVLTYQEIYWPVFGVLLFLSLVFLLACIVTCYFFIKTVRKSQDQAGRTSEAKTYL